MIGKPHVLSVSDVQRGIQALAAFLLGDSSQATILISTNNLTPPYLTLDPSEVYGPPTADQSLSDALSSGADAISISNLPLSINQVYLSYAGSTGLVAESINVANFNGQTINLATPTMNAYPVGSRIQLFSSYSLANNVLLPGDILFVPVTTTSNSFNVTNQQQLIDTFGSDIESPITFANGDIATVSGLATFYQRILSALQTMVGSLPLWPLWGSQLSSAVGTPSGSVKWSAIVANCLTQLPEVDSVTNITVTTQGNQVYISCVVNANTSDTAIQLQNEAFTLTAA